MMKKQKIAIIPFLLLSLFLAFAYQCDLLDGSMRMGEDLLSVHYPQQQSAADNEISPSYRFGPGLDLLGEGQTGVLSPINIMIRMMGIGIGFTVITIFLHFLAFLGMGLLMRQRGLSIKACLIAMIAYGGSLFFLLKVEHWMNFQVLCLLPLAVYGQERKDFKGIILSGIIFGLVMLGGAQQFVGIAFLILLINSWLEDCFSFRYFLIVIVIGLSLAAPQLTATWNQFQISERVSGVDSVQHSLPLSHLLGVFFSHPYGAPAQGNYLGGGPFWEFALFSGVVSIVLLKHTPRKYVLVLLMALFVSLGSHFPLLSWMHDLYPLNLFRVPARYAFVFVFFVAVAAAHGFENFRIPKRVNVKMLNVVGILMSVVLLVLVILCYRGTFIETGEQLWVEIILPRWKERLLDSDHAFSYFQRAFVSAFNGTLVQIGISVFACVMTFVFMKKRRFDFVVFLLFSETLLAAYSVRGTVTELDIAETKKIEKKGLLLTDFEEFREREVAVCEVTSDWKKRYLAARPFVSSQLYGSGSINALHHSPLHSFEVKTWQGLLRNSLAEKTIKENNYFYQRSGIDYVSKKNMVGHWTWVKVPYYEGQDQALFYEGVTSPSTKTLHERMKGRRIQDSLEFETEELISPAIPVPLTGEKAIYLDKKYQEGYLRLPSYLPGWMALVDDKEVPIVSVEYVASAIKIPAAAKQVVLIQKSTIPLWSVYLALTIWVLVLISWIYLTREAWRSDKL